MSSDWRLTIEHKLIEAGTVGLKASDINTAVQGQAHAATIQQHLNALLAERKVQRFEIGTATVWRATTKILEK